MKSKKTFSFNKWREEHWEHWLQQQRERRKGSQKHIQEVKRWQGKNPKLVCSYKRKHNQKARQTIERRLRDRISTGLRNSLKGRKVKKTFSYVKFTLLELKEHLQKTFPANYTWDNFLTGELHIDHIKPVSKCLSVEEAWELSNLQFLPKIENLRKSNKWQIA